MEPSVAIFSKKKFLFKEILGQKILVPERLVFQENV